MHTILRLIYTYLELGLSTIARSSSKGNQSWCSFTTTSSINFSQFLRIHLWKKKRSKCTNSIEEDTLFLHIWSSNLFTSRFSWISDSANTQFHLTAQAFIMHVTSTPNTTTKCLSGMKCNNDWCGRILFFFLLYSHEFQTSSCLLLHQWEF